MSFGDKPPVDLPISRTLDFLLRHLPAPPLRLLEVGCGSGRLAKRLSEKGFQIVGIDLSPDDVQEAQEAGLDVRLADILAFDEKPFDAILFVRSLHHIPDLATALGHAADLLRPGGLLIAEEFDVEQVDYPTAAWYYRVQSLLVAAELLPWDPRPVSPDPLMRWQEAHRHGEIHTGWAMLSEASCRFELTLKERLCYLYRYFCVRLLATPKDRQLAERILQAEECLLKAGILRPVGLRFIGMKNPPGRF